MSKLHMAREGNLHCVKPRYKISEDIFFAYVRTKSYLDYIVTFETVVLHPYFHYRSFRGFQ